MNVFTNLESWDRIVYAISSRFNDGWKTDTPNLSIQAILGYPASDLLDRRVAPS
jgi:hypothetical protein